MSTSNDGLPRVTGNIPDRCALIVLAAQGGGFRIHFPEDDEPRSVEFTFKNMGPRHHCDYYAYYVNGTIPGKEDPVNVQLLIDYRRTGMDIRIEARIYYHPKDE